MILVTGGSGFLGRYLVPRLLDEYPDTEIRTISRDENTIRRLLTRCPNNRLVPIVGDIRDQDTARYALRDVDTVIHLAAMKHIDLCEMYPTEVTTVNIDGTRNILNSFSGSTFVYMSTDKAVNAVSCYGATKLIAEKLVLDQAKRKSGRYMVIRTGNIFGSTGSVIDVWKHQIEQDNRINITDINMTKFFINVNTLVDFIMLTMESGESSNVYIPYQKALILADLAEAVISLYGNQTTGPRFVGIRPGEKMHEVLFADGEKIATSLPDNLSSNAPRLTVNEIKRWLKNLESN